MDLVQNGFFAPPVVPLQGSLGHRSALRPLCLLAELVSRFARVGYVSIRQTGSIRIHRMHFSVNDPRPRQSHLNDGGLFAAFCMADRQSARAPTLPFPHSFRPLSVDQRQRSLQRPGSDFNMQSSCDPSPNVTAITEGAPDTRLRRKGSTESRSNSALLTSCSRTTNQACSPHHAANTISPPSSALDTA